MHAIYLDSKDVPSQLRGSYVGKKFRAKVSLTGFIPSTAGNWDSGSRDTFTLVELSTGRSVPVSDNVSPPWGNRSDRGFDMRPGFVLVEHSISMGKDIGLTFTVHPDDATKMLPSSVQLTVIQQLVLNSTARFKSSYGGMNRYEMAKSDQYGVQHFPTIAEWELAKSELIALKLLNAAGAITTAGRNARNS